ASSDAKLAVLHLLGRFVANLSRCRLEIETLLLRHQPNIDLGRDRTAHALLRLSRDCASCIGLATRLCGRRRGVLRALPEGTEGIDYASWEACFEAKAHEGSVTDVGSRWALFVAGGRRIRRNRWASSRYTLAEHRTESRNHSP